MHNWGTVRFVGLTLLVVSMSGVPCWAQTATETPAPGNAAAGGAEIPGPEFAPDNSLDIVGDLIKPLVLAVVFTSVGLVLFAISIWLIVKLSPFSIRREIEEDQNVALGIIVGAMVLGMAIILSAAILG